MLVVRNADLKPYHTFSVSQRALELWLLESVEDIPCLIEDLASHPMPHVLLGAGSNTLFTRDYAGRVILNRLQGKVVLEEDENSVLLQVAAGENWHELVLYSLKQGYGGIENLSLIPGSVGAAVVQNIGAYGVEFVSVLAFVEAIDLKAGEKGIFQKEDCALSYRDSIFKHAGYENWLITSVVLRLSKKPKFVLTYRGLEELQQRNHLTPADVSEVVIKLRESKLPDPSVIANAGSFFKNPVIDSTFAKSFCEKYPDCPHFPHGIDTKISAAWLLEQLGWKGFRDGDAGVYEHHALVLVNHGLATGDELLKLAHEMQNSVQRQFHIGLEPEVKLV